MCPDLEILEELAETNPDAAYEWTETGRNTWPSSLDDVKGETNAPPESDPPSDDA